MRQWPVPHCLEVRLGEGRGEEGGGNSDREKFKGIVAKGGAMNKQTSPVPVMLNLMKDSVSSLCFGNIMVYFRNG